PIRAVGSRAATTSSWWPMTASAWMCSATPELRGRRSTSGPATVRPTSSSTTAGTPDIVQQAPGTAGNALWLPVQQSDGSYEFRNQNSGLCLDVFGAGSNPGQQLDQWP